MSSHKISYYWCWYYDYSYTHSNSSPPKPYSCKKKYVNSLLSVWYNVLIFVIFAWIIYPQIFMCATLKLIHFKSSLRDCVLVCKSQRTFDFLLTIARFFRKKSQNVLYILFRLSQELMLLSILHISLLMIIKYAWNRCIYSRKSHCADSNYDTIFHISNCPCTLKNLFQKLIFQSWPICYVWLSSQMSQKTTKKVIPVLYLVSPIHSDESFAQINNILFFVYYYFSVVFLFVFFSLVTMAMSA